MDAAILAELDVHGLTVLTEQRRCSGSGSHVADRGVPQLNIHVREEHAGFSARERDQVDFGQRSKTAYLRSLASMSIY